MTSLILDLHHEDRARVPNDCLLSHESACLSWWLPAMRPFCERTNRSLSPSSPAQLHKINKSFNSFLFFGCFFVSSKEDATAFCVIRRWLCHHKELMLALSVLVIICLSQVWCFGQASAKLQGGTYLVKTALMTILILLLLLIIIPIIVMIIVRRKRRRS